MSVENLTENESLPIENSVAENKSKFANPMLWIQLITFILGFALLVFVIYRIGLHTLFDAFARIGWGFLAIVALNGARHFIRALCMYIAVPVRHRSFKYRYAVSARLAGEAVSFLTFTGPLLGEATKAALLKKRIPLSHGVTAVVVDNILYDISVALLILGGVGVMFYVYGGGDSPAMRDVLYGVATVAALTIVAIIVAAKSRFKPLSWTLKKLSARGWLPRFMETKQRGVYELEDNIHELYANRKTTFFSMFGLIILSHVLSVVEVYAALHMLGETTVQASTAYIIESLTKVINFAFGFVPGTVGVYEGGNGIILHSLGYPTATGVTLALVRRGAILFWTIIGLVILLWRGVARGTQHLTRRES
ncbi:MAG: lysylphosphatidylglycerol synthase domain-containing protein [Pyrinomonadaceae bacterium]